LRSLPFIESSIQSIEILGDDRFLPSGLDGAYTNIRDVIKTPSTIRLSAQPQVNVV
jgi:hypothetical protein